MSGYLSARLIVALVRWGRRGRAGGSDISTCLAYVVHSRIEYPFFKKELGIEFESWKQCEIAARSDAFTATFLPNHG